MPKKVKEEKKAKKSPATKAVKKDTKKDSAKKAIPKKVVKKTVAKKVAKKITPKKEPKKQLSAKTKDTLKGNGPDNVEKVLLTQDGLQQLKEELEYLKETKRDEVAKRLQEAISYGDLSENSEYEEAKNEQAFCEGRIAELEKMIKNVEIIDEQHAHKTAVARIGTTVVIKNLTKDEEAAEFTIVGSTEADPFLARISNESPIGKALLGKKKGDKVLINAPGGDFEFQLIDLK